MRSLFLLLFLCTPLAWGAFPSTQVWEIRSNGGNVNNGCGFDTSAAPGGAPVDYSQQTNSQYNGTDLVSTNATTNPCVVTSATHNFVAADEHNTITISAGSNWTVSRYEIVSTSGNAATLDRACGTVASISGGTYRVGGACPLGNATAGVSDDALFEHGVAGNTYYIAGTGVGTGTYSPTAISIAAAGGTQNPIKVIGYASTRGDNPTGSTRPTLGMTSGNLNLGANWNFSNIMVTTTAANGLQSGVSSQISFTKVINSSTTAGRTGIGLNNSAMAYKNEAISYRGNAFALLGSNLHVTGNYVHDSDIGMSYTSTTGTHSIIGNIFEGNVTTGLSFTGNNTTNGSLIQGNTFYGAENKLGTAVSFSTGNTNFRLFNNILYGFVTGVSHADSQSVGLDDYNDYSNITTDVTNWTKGSHDVALNPTFTSVTQYTGSTATTSGSVLTQSGATFPTFVPGTDFVYIKSGTGVTVGVYGITSNTATTITLDIAPGTSAVADKVFQVTTGHNFGVGTTMRAIGSLGTFPGALTTGYLDLGAAQRRERITTGGSH